MLLKEQKFFLDTLSDHLSGKKTAIPDGLDIPLLLSIAKQQQCDGILYHQTHLAVLQPSFAMQYYRSANRNHHLTTIHAKFCEAKIPYLIFKGSEIASFYPVPQLRTMGDLDILVHQQDKKKADEVLQSCGYHCESTEAIDHEWIYWNGNYEVELHHRLLYDSSLNNEEHLAFTDNVWDYAVTTDGIQYHLTAEFHFAYLLLHLRKHFLWAGIGVQQFIDLAVMTKKADIHWDMVENYLSLLDLLPFAGICFALIERWFALTVPIAFAPITDEFYESATNTILADGVFGRRETEQMVSNSILNTMRKKGRLLPVLAILFPPCCQMQEKYPKMSQYPILLPLMWVRRMLGAIARKNVANNLQYAGKYLVKDEKMKEREALLKAWGCGN